MNSIKKSIFCLNIFGAMLHCASQNPKNQQPNDSFIPLPFGYIVATNDDSGSDSDSDRSNNQLNNELEESAYGLCPIGRISQYLRKYEEDINRLQQELDLSRKLSQDKLRNIRPIPLSESLEISQEEEEEKSKHSVFLGLVRRISSLKSDINRRVNRGDEPSPFENTVNGLVGRLVVIQRENHFEIPKKFSDLFLDPVLDPDQGFFNVKKQSSQNLLEELEIDINKRTRLSVELEQKRIIRNESITLEIPKALSFKYVLGKRTVEHNKVDLTRETKIFSSSSCSSNDFQSSDEKSSNNDDE